MNNNINIFMLSKHKEKILLGFESKKTQWLFIKKFLPDVADAIVNIANALDGIEPPKLWVKESWLMNLEDIILIDKRK